MKKNEKKKRKISKKTTIILSLLILTALGAFSIYYYLQKTPKTFDVLQEIQFDSMVSDCVSYENTSFVASHDGKIYKIVGNTKDKEADFKENIFKIRLSNSKNYLLIIGDSLSLLDKDLNILWKKSEKDFYAEDAVFTVNGNIKVLFSCISDLKKRVVLYDIKGKTISSFAVPDFLKQSTVSLSTSDLVSITIDNGELYLLKDDGKIIFNKTIENQNYSCSSLRSEFSNDSKHIIGGFSYLADENLKNLKRYIFNPSNQNETVIIEVPSSVTSFFVDNKYIYAYGDSLLIFKINGEKILDYKKVGFLSFFVSLSKDDNLNILWVNDKGGEEKIYVLEQYSIPSKKITKQFSFLEKKTIFLKTDLNSEVINLIIDDKVVLLK